MRGGNKGGITAIPLFMIIGLVAIVSIWLFFTFFKLHVTSIAIDVDSINRYQEVPTTMLSNALYADDKEKPEGYGPGKYDKRVYEKKKVHCFQGDGPAGAHQHVNKETCTKSLALFFTKTANGFGEPVLSDGSAGTDFKDNLRLALPTTCYLINLMSSDESGAKTDFFGKSEGDCNIGGPKISERYPIPVFSGTSPSVAVNELTIGTTLGGREGLITWPRYSSCFTSDPICEQVRQAAEKKNKEDAAQKAKESGGVAA